MDGPEDRLSNSANSEFLLYNSSSVPPAQGSSENGYFDYFGAQESTLPSFLVDALLPEDMPGRETYFSRSSEPSVFSETITRPHVVPPIPMSDLRSIKLEPPLAEPASARYGVVMMSDRAV
eukprot:TRINITY_DN2318_c0_g1_i1.p2 TRINITY_DN2318_c0_g1~~TRINITY_DN2318_c0_g1_i1.p2  ORF type:complete len:121 (+),score=2.08 TRINITY_DN2318_c0_g1_i1:170-532(+)